MADNFILKKRESKNTAQRIKRLLFHPRIVLREILRRVSKYITNDRLYLKLVWWCEQRCYLNLNNPTSFQEKLQWLKLFNRKPVHTDLVDKHKVKQIVTNIIGEEYIIPTIGIWASFEEIDFNSLPQKFVLKCTHDSGGLVICRNKNDLDVDLVKKKIDRCLKRKYFYENREWPYKNVKPMIIAEKYLEEAEGKDLNDYKFYCFNGKAEYCQVISGRTTNETIDFYDTEWYHQPFFGLNPIARNNPPQNYKLMVNLASTLAGISESPFVRVDFYNVEGKIYFGEITYFPAGGFGTFTPKEWNLKLGAKITLSNDKNC